MASSSTSSVQKCFKYDVFLSFRGEDTRNTFVGHLYNALQHKSIHTYKDDERIKKGERISDELIKSIEDSKFYIIVFSKNYASSSWCLQELVKIMECQKKKKSEHTAYPVFYDVEPTEVRKQSGEFGNAFAKHEKEEAAGKWREAMKEAADLAGWELKKTVDGDEAKFIQKIVEEISLELRSINVDIDEKLVGMETRIKGVVSSLEMGFDDVRMLGIKGMGGAGKTTLARAVFNQISIQFEGKSFVENVREISKGSFYGLKSLQEKILSNVLNDMNITVDSIHEGKKMMKKRMCCIKVLVVLDDVDNIQQLEALVGERNWFKPGSRIIITTRDEQVLDAHRVNFQQVKPHDVDLLSNRDAICLFSRYAFGRDIPIHGYEELSKQVVDYAAGLPLTMRVLGSSLCGKNELEWKDALKRLKTIPSKDTLDVLEISYIGLEKEHKEIFLDVACLLKYWKKKDAIRRLESCGFYARIGLRVLEQKSLITIDEYGRLDMHDRIREMGKYIVRRKLEEPNKHSRLWKNEEIKDVMVSDQGTNEAIRCIKLDISKVDPKIVMKGFGNMKKLRFLQVDYHEEEDCFNRNWKFDEDRPYFPNALRSLRWLGYPFGSLPKSFQANNLVDLDLTCSEIVQLWEGEDTKVLNKLRFLDLNYSIKLKNLDLGLTPNLETLNLEECEKLVELHMPAECPKLRSLKVSYSKLTTLDLRGTPNLEKLNIDRCVDLVELHIPGERLKLKSVEIKGSKLTTLDLRGTPNLEMLNIDRCVDLVELHIPGESLKLEFVEISSSKLRTLDLRGTPNLVELTLYECLDLVELHIPGERLKFESIKINNSKLRALDLRGTPNLETLFLTKCYHLVEVHTHDGCLKKLHQLDLSDCLRFKAFSFNKLLSSSSSIEVGCISKLHLKAESLEICPLHIGNNLPNFRFECFYEEHGSSLIGNVEKLISFGLCACTNLERFSQSICGLRCLTTLTLEGNIPEAPKDLDQLECLEQLHLLSTRLPDNICKLKHLKCLKLERCWLLEKLPDDLGRLECLEMLILSDCVFLQHIPDSICMMKRLQYFLLSGCTAVEKLPEEIGRLRCLKELNIEGTNIRHLPESIFEVKGLLIVGYRWLLQSYGFTSPIPTTIQTKGGETLCYVEL